MSKLKVVLETCVLGAGSGDPYIAECPKVWTAIAKKRHKR